MNCLIFFFFSCAFVRLCVHIGNPKLRFCLWSHPEGNLNEVRTWKGKGENSVIMEDHKSGLGNEDCVNCLKVNTDKKPWQTRMRQRVMFLLWMLILFIQNPKFFLAWTLLSRLFIWIPDSMLSLAVFSMSLSLLLRSAFQFKLHLVHSRGHRSL